MSHSFDPLHVRDIQAKRLIAIIEKFLSTTANTAGYEKLQSPYARNRTVVHDLRSAASNIVAENKVSHHVIEKLKDCLRRLPVSLKPDATTTTTMSGTRPVERIGHCREINEMHLVFGTEDDSYRSPRGAPTQQRLDPALVSGSHALKDSSSKPSSDQSYTAIVSDSASAEHITRLLQQQKDMHTRDLQQEAQVKVSLVQELTEMTDALKTTTLSINQSVKLQNLVRAHISS